MSLRVDEISNEGGTGPVVLTDQIAQKIYATVDGESGTPALQESLGASSIVDNGTGDYTLNFTTAMSTNTYGVSGNAGEVTLAGDRVLGVGARNSNQLVGSLTYGTFELTGASSDSYNYPAILGDLA